MRLPGVRLQAFALVIGFIALLDGASLVSAQEMASSHDPKQDQQPIRYEADEGLPRDKAGEKRRDYAVLEAALNDLACPKNPEHKPRIRAIGPGREIVIGDEWTHHFPFTDVRRMSDDDEDIPADIRQDFHRRNVEPAGSLSVFKPANPDILVRDLNEEFKDSDDYYGDFKKKYPTAWGLVWAYPPGFSKDGDTVLVVFEYGPIVRHGSHWASLLTRKGKRWEVQWRHHRVWQ